MRRNACRVVLVAGLCRTQDQKAKFSLDWPKVIFVKRDARAFFRLVMPIYAVRSGRHRVVV